ncbi:FAD-dependent catabolic D-arginine dehydrogenase DauA [Pseudooceanicola nitratireducens]|uniref:NAD(P)/FAD-dependent oxidoreductase n=1 Tax=Pseudooceanicola nitratireducens TaxID=517719 RepID=UPI003109FA98
MINESQPTVILIGAGIAGISAAAALADHAQVTLIERETQPAYHATGRSAAIQSQAYGSPAVRALTRASDPFLSNPPDGFSEHPLLTPRGLISVARADQLDHLRAEYEENSDSALTWLNADEVESRLPLLRRGYAVAGFLNADAQDIDVHALVQGYLRQFRAAGGRLIRGAEVTEIRKTGDHWQLRAGDDILQADIVVNAAGAWADGLARIAGVDPIGLVPLRRSALTFRPPEGVDTAAMPMILDAEERFYVKPDAGMLLASPANESPSDPVDSQPEDIEIAEAMDRVLQALDLDVRRIESKWAGLRTFPPDRTPICGFDPDHAGFFWLAGQGGYGIQTAPAMAALAAHLISGAPLPAPVRDLGPDPALLSPARFR